MQTISIYDSQINKEYLDLPGSLITQFFKPSCQLNNSINNIITRPSNMTVKCKMFILPPLPSTSIEIAST